MKYIIYILFSAIAFTMVVPHVHGAYFHGTFATGLLFGLLMGLVAIVIGLIEAAVATATVGVALIPIFIFHIFCFWLLPAIQLRIVAFYWPNHLGFTGWGPAIIAGLAFLVVKWISKLFK